MKSEIYSDGIGEITVTGSVVRVDLMTLSATERDASNNLKSVVRQRIIFPVEGFANAVELMQKALKGLVEMGAIRHTSASAASELVHPNDVVARANLSPNFR
jgi:hypothetical protein